MREWNTFDELGGHINVWRRLVGPNGRSAAERKEGVQLSVEGREERSVVVAREKAALAAGIAHSQQEVNDLSRRWSTVHVVTEKHESPSARQRSVDKSPKRVDMSVNVTDDPKFLHSRTFARAE